MSGMQVRRHQTLWVDITGWNLDEKNCCVNCGYQLPIVGGLSSSVAEDRFLPVIN